MTTVPLQPRLKAEIVREIKRLECLLEMIATVETERDAILKCERLSHLNADKIKMLARLKAIGPEFSTTLVGEVFYREFANRPQLGSYVGLASSPFCSGSLDRNQGISKAGNPKARAMMIEPRAAVRPAPQPSRSAPPGNRGRRHRMRRRPPGKTRR
jgi:transposase